MANPSSTLSNSVIEKTSELGLIHRNLDVKQPVSMLDEQTLSSVYYAEFGKSRNLNST